MFFLIVLVAGVGAFTGSALAGNENGLKPTNATAKGTMASGSSSHLQRGGQVAREH